jgi:hypothetical protein
LWMQKYGLLLNYASRNQILVKIFSKFMLSKKI